MIHLRLVRARVGWRPILGFCLGCCVVALLVGCAAPGEADVADELSRLEDTVIDGADVRRFEMQHEEIACDGGGSSFARRGFITVDDRGADIVRAEFVESYEARGWSIEQYRSEGLDGIVRLVARSQDGELLVDVMIWSSGGIDLGIVQWSPCDSYQRIVGRDWEREPVGS